MCKMDPLDQLTRGDFPTKIQKPCTSIIRRRCRQATPFAKPVSFFSLCPESRFASSTCFQNRHLFFQLASEIDLPIGKQELCRMFEEDKLEERVAEAKGLVSYEHTPWEPLEDRVPPTFRREVRAFQRFLKWPWCSYEVAFEGKGAAPFVIVSGKTNRRSKLL
jgi:hypothetical protein